MGNKAAQVIYLEKSVFDALFFKIRGKSFNVEFLDFPTENHFKALIYFNSSNSMSQIIGLIAGPLSYGPSISQ